MLRKYFYCPLIIFCLVFCYYSKVSAQEHEPAQDHEHEESVSGSQGHYHPELAQTHTWWGGCVIEGKVLYRETGKAVKDISIQYDHPHPYTNLSRIQRAEVDRKGRFKIEYAHLIVGPEPTKENYIDLFPKRWPGNVVNLSLQVVRNGKVIYTMEVIAPVAFFPPPEKVIYETFAGFDSWRKDVFKKHPDSIPDITIPTIYIDQ